MDAITLVGDYTWGYFTILAFFGACHFIYTNINKQYKNTLFGNVAALLTSIFILFLVLTPIIWFISLPIVTANSSLIISFYFMVLGSICSWAVIFIIPILILIFILNILFSSFSLFIYVISKFFKK